MSSPSRGEPPVASVIVPALDSAATISEQLDALAAQAGAPPFEVIVADNGSRDGTQAIVREWAEKLPALRLVDASERTGSCAARNAGVAAAASDLLLFCDADDVADAGWVRAMVDALDEAHAVGGVLHDDRLNDEVVRSWYEGTPERLFDRYRYLPFASGACFGVRREALDRIGGWDESFAQGTDADVCFRLQLDGDVEIGVATDAVMHYRYRQDLRGMGRQMRGYGRASVAIWRRYRDRGLQQRPHRDLMRSIGWLVSRAPGSVWGVTGRGRWYRRFSTTVGIAQALVRRQALTRRSAE